MSYSLADINDPHRTLSYSTIRMGKKVLLLGLVCLGLGGALAVLQPGGFRGSDWGMTVLTLALGAGFSLYGAHRWLAPGKPLLVLSPAGLRIRVEWVKDIDIPWREVRGMDAINIAGSLRGEPMHFTDVTAVLVTRDFYERHIHVRSWLLRGPGWDMNFIPKGKYMQVALHHEILPATSDELFRAVETRLRAFGDTEPAQAAPLASQRPPD